MIPPFPARLHILFSGNSNSALIIRRGPSKQVAIIGWNRENDQFALGQWLKGHIYETRCDLSPDGKYFLYFAMGSRGDTWTAISYTPYLKALMFKPWGSTWGGGGIFTSNTSYCLAGSTLNNNTGFNHCALKHDTEYQMAYPIYTMRLLRSGWEMNKIVRKETEMITVPFVKKIHTNWLLGKLFGLNHRLSNSQYVESHWLINTITGKIIEYPDWMWAEFDRNRLVWAENGKLMSAKIGTQGLWNIKELHDFNAMKFEEKIAPY